MPVLGLPVTAVERLWEEDRRWIYRAIALQEAETIAAPIRRQHDEQRAKEEAEARKEAERAAIREAKRQMWRNRQQQAEMREAVASD